MRLRKRTQLRLFLFFIPDLLLSGLIILHFYYNIFSGRTFLFVLGGVILLLFLRIILFTFISINYYRNRIRVINSVLSMFKKGKFMAPQIDVRGDDELKDLFQELMVVGRHFDSVISSQKTEIDKFQELYNSIVFSISTYFLVLNEEQRVVFVNEGFCTKFKFNQKEITGKKVEEIFYFVNARLKGGISQAIEIGKSIILEKTHLLTVNKISIIADVKISKINVQGKNHIIIIIDDVTNKLRKDYQISLMSQISESIQKDAEIERVLYTILTGVTSGAGLGFNRAMLFLVEGNYLVGKMAVGPDSFEEAIDIWSSVSSSGTFLEEIETTKTLSGRELLNRVMATKFSLSSENVLIRSLEYMESVHIFDSWSDENVNEEIREFIDVKEFVVVPLIVVNKAIGVIVADNKFNQAPIGNDSIELLSIFASQAALSIESYNSLDSVRVEMKKISERQDAIIESEKMAAVGRIASHIAHEIRNPLVTMGGYARRVIQLAKDNPRINPNIVRAAEIILKESERLEKTLSNVMDFSKPAKYIREFNNINEIIRDTLELLKNIFQEKNISVNKDLHENIPLVKSDFNQMKQVMLNLLQNSIDATPMGGTITITSASTNDAVTIKISDTGTGIDEDDPNAVFEPFYTTKVTGVGLGLAIVKKIIKDHNGDISVRNLKEGGVEFEIQLSIPG